MFQNVQTKSCRACSRSASGGFYDVAPTEQQLTAAFAVQSFFQCIQEDVASMNNSQSIVTNLCGGSGVSGFVPIAMNQSGALASGEPGVATVVGVGAADFIVNQGAVVPVGNQGSSAPSNDQKFLFQKLM